MRKIVQSFVAFSEKLVQTLWEGHKISNNLPPVLTKQLFLLSSIKPSGRFFQSFVTFSEKLDFNLMASKYEKKNFRKKTSSCLDANDVCHKRNINRKVKCLIWHNDRAGEKDRYENTSEWGENPIAGRKCALHDMNFLRGGMKWGEKPTRWFLALARWKKEPN